MLLHNWLPARLQDKPLLPHKTLQIVENDSGDLLIQSVGFNPQLFGKRNKLSQLVRLIPFCERNYNLIELGPKGTGKSHIFSEFSPHGILISGGEVKRRALIAERRRWKP